MQCVSNGDDLKFLLQSKQCHGKLAKSSIGMCSVCIYMSTNASLSVLFVEEVAFISLLMFFFSSLPVR